MPRPKRDPARKVPPPIEPTAVYSRRDVMALIPGLGYEGLLEELRAGRLRQSVRAGKNLVLGQWVLDWILAGEVAAAEMYGQAA